MKLSIIIAVYNSHGVIERQMKFFSKLQLPDDIEFILVDDGSSPRHEGYSLKNLKIIYTNDKRPWTQGLARNRGVKESSGEYILMTDADHILSYEAIMDSYNFTGDKMIFPRFLAVLDEDGCLTQEKQVLKDYGIDESRFTSKRGLYASYHGNTFCMKKSTFENLGGYPEKACTYGHHATSKKGEDSYFNTRWNHYAVKYGLKPIVGSKIYIFPIGRYNVNYDLNPKGLFHSLSYEPVAQPNKL
ncbi:glycosyltransferase family 2 protein [Patescibacteria group bacterium]|nr:glycosyltransferase family 2 protein [Patescibacteria group bacterium]